MDNANIKKYNEHYAKYREAILANAKLYQKKKQMKIRQEKENHIVLEYLQKIEKISVSTQT